MTTDVGRPPYEPIAISDAWFDYRAGRHRRFEELGGVPDASRFGYMHGESVPMSEDDVVGLWRSAAATAAKRQGAVNHVYVHVPFCKAVCSFCNYERLKPSSPDGIAQYTRRVLRSLDAIAPEVAPMRWHTLYFGGGTPSVLPTAQLATLLEAIEEKLNWHPRSTRFFEFDPAVMSEERLALLVKHRFRHFSFGIQTLDSDVNISHGRGPQGRELVTRRFKEIRDAGVHNLSCDLLLGLKGTTPESMLEDVDAVLALRPRWLDLFFIVPTPQYLTSHWGDDHEAFWAHLKAFQERIPPALGAIAQKHGFRVRRGGGHHIVVYRQMAPWERGADGEDGVFCYTQLVDQQRRPLHLLGLGPSARSLIFGEAQVHCQTPDAKTPADAPHTYTGHRTGMEGEVRQFLCHMLRDQHVLDRALFEQIFGMDITEAIPTALAAWHRMGKVQVTPEQVVFAPEDNRERVRTLMWLVPDGRMAFEVDRHESNLRAMRTPSRTVAS